MGSALDHLRVANPGSADLTIQIWDGASTGVLPPVSVQIEEDQPEGARYVYEGHVTKAVYQPGYETLSVITHDLTRAWHWAGSVETLPYTDRAAPLRLLLHWWTMGRGIHLVHGGAVATDDGAALFVGSGGSGKSTATLACTVDGLRYGGDDYVLIEPGTPPIVHPLYSSGKLACHHLERFPALLPASALDGVPPGEKAVAFLDRHGLSMMPSSRPLTAVLVPRVVTGPTRIAPMSKAGALAALAPSTIFQMPGTLQRELSAFADVLRDVPTYALELGPDLSGLARLVEAVIEQ